MLCRVSRKKTVSSPVACQEESATRSEVMIALYFRVVKNAM